MDGSSIPTAVGSILRSVIDDVIAGAGLAILRGPAGIGKTFALDRITADLVVRGVDVVRATASPANGKSISAFTSTVLSQYRIEAGSTADGVEAMYSLLRGYPFQNFGRRVVFLVDEAQELASVNLETIRSLWDRGTHARLGMTGGPAFGCALVGNEMFMGKGGNLRVAGFRPLMSRVTHNVRLPAPDKSEIAALAAALFPGQAELSAELIQLGAVAGNLRALDSVARTARIAAGDKPVTVAMLRHVIKMKGGV